MWNAFWTALLSGPNLAIFLVVILGIAFYIGIWSGRANEERRTARGMEVRLNQNMAALEERQRIHVHEVEERQRAHVREVKEGLQGEIRQVKEGLQGEIRQVKEGLQREIGEVKADMREVKKDIRALFTLVADIGKQVSALCNSRAPQSSATQANSPLRLTPLGEEICKAIDVDALMAQYGERLGQIVKQQNPTHVYDVQNTSTAATEHDLPGMMTTEQLNEFKTQAFKHDIPLFNALTVVAIPLRDKLLTELGLSMEEAMGAADDRNASAATAR